MKNLIYYLKQFAFSRRVDLFEEKKNLRTRYITIVLENLFQSHNASAILRTCDCLGIQDIYAIENDNKFKICDTIALGSSKWLSLNYYNNQQGGMAKAISELKKKGYRIVATTPHANALELDQLDLTKGKIALVFGTELEGISEETMKLCDEFIKIPIWGFTESYNVSVSAGIILYTLIQKLKSSGIDWQLSEEEKNELLLNWLKSSVKDADKIIKRYQNSANE